MATSLDVRTYVMMGRSNDADTVSLELVDLEFLYSWSRKDLAPFIGKQYLLFSYVCHLSISRPIFSAKHRVGRSVKMQ